MKEHESLSEKERVKNGEKGTHNIVAVCLVSCVVSGNEIFQTLLSRDRIKQKKKSKVHDCVTV